MSEFLKNNEAHLRTISFLKSEIIKKGYDWNTAKSKPIDAALYANTQVQVGGSVDLLDGATTEVRGTTNFNGNKLVKGRPAVINSIALGFAIGTPGQLPHALDFDYSKTHHDLQFANLVMKQKDEVLIKLPITSIVDSLKDGSKYRELSSLVLVEDESIIDLTVEFPPQLVSKVPTGKVLFVSAMFQGHEVYLKR
ncbi:hypothetical protein [Tenacibaculum piscium]|uniref:hypothetical protein n=1 Tax=Tenacibaculum piscium TaxID=1458515 RepID=UPI00187B1B75|nr:hypothetical protein [Tenacibaculum piscium]MBE7671564.1 hypothetical protein [Tenacibaculum piscium]